MNKICWLGILCATFVCCKSKRISLAGDEKVDANDFVGSFETARLPYAVTDSIFLQDDNDSLLISYDVFTQFVPDTVISRHFARWTEPDLYPVARVRGEKKENYLFCKAITDDKEVLYLLCFDKSNKFIASKVLFAYDDNSDYEGIVTVDNKCTINVTHQHRTDEGEWVYRKNAYVLNDAGGFTLILTESNEAAARAVNIIDPIDTLPRKHKFSGDYVEDKRNFIAIRDARTPASFLFFIHFEKEGGACNGELKGEARFTSGNAAQFHGNADPCVINFWLEGNKVSMKEAGGCGNHRDIKCFFEGSFLKRKESRPKSVQVKKKAPSR